MITLQQVPVLELLLLILVQELELELAQEPELAQELELELAQELAQEPELAQELVQAQELEQVLALKTFNEPWKKDIVKNISFKAQISSHKSKRVLDKFLFLIRSKSRIIWSNCQSSEPFTFMKLPSELEEILEQKKNLLSAAGQKFH